MKLNLLPFYKDENFSIEILAVEINELLFKKIKEIPSKEVEYDFQSYLSTENDMDEHFGTTMTDQLEEPIKYVFAKDLKKVKIGGAQGGYISKMKATQKIALFWY